MSKLKSCSIVTNKDSIDRYSRNFRSASIPDLKIHEVIEPEELKFIPLDEIEHIQNQADLLVVEDGWNEIAYLVRAASKDTGIRHVIVATSSEALRKIIDTRSLDPKVITLDFNLRGVANPGREVFDETLHLYRLMRTVWSKAVLIGITAWESSKGGTPHPDSAALVNALRSNENPDDVFEKNDSLMIHVAPNLLRNALEIYSLRLKVETEKKQSEEQAKISMYFGVPMYNELPNNIPIDNIVGTSTLMRIVYLHIEKYAAADNTVLIRGESGTGKNLVAKAIHDISKRKNGPFVELNCVGLPDELLISELFGVAPNYPGFHSREGLLGKIEQAQDGTLFLDEIGDLSLKTQAALLNFLNDRSYSPLGGTVRTANVRIITATNKSLEDLINQTIFRADFYGRIKPQQFCIPPLRERPEDILTLTNFFLLKHSQEHDKRLMNVTNAALKKLQNYSWPENARELNGVIENAVIWAPNDGHDIDEALIVFHPSGGHTENTKRMNIPEILSSKLVDAINWLNAIEAAIEKLSQIGRDITNESVGDNIISPSSKGVVTGQRISQVFSDYNHEISEIMNLNLTKWQNIKRWKGLPKAT